MTTPSEKRQLNLSLTDREYEQIEGMAEKLGLEKKDLILRCIKKSQERLIYEDLDPHVTEEVEECMKSANGLFGFNMQGLIQELENHGLQWTDFSEADQTLVLGRFKEHAEWWGYSGAQVKEGVGKLAECLKVESKLLLRKYYSLNRDDKEEEPSESSLEC
jgi:hypothetical protein